MGDGAWSVELACVARVLQIGQDLLVDLAELVAVALFVEVDFAQLVDDLPQQGAGLHVVVGVLEHAAHYTGQRGVLARHGQFFQCFEQVVVDEVEEGLAGDALGIRRPGTPAEAFGDGGLVAVLHQLAFGLGVVEDFEEQHPDELADALGVAIHTSVLAHDVLDGFHGGTEGHASPLRGFEQLVFKVVDGLDIGVFAAELLDDLHRRAVLVDGANFQDGDVFDVVHALVGELVEQGIQHLVCGLAVLGEVV